MSQHPTLNYAIQANFAELETRALASGLKGMHRVGVRDVHLETAAEMFGKPSSEITEDERRLAKAANFLRVYGGCHE